MRKNTNPLEELERFFERMSRQSDEPSYRWGSQGPLTWWTPENETMAVDIVNRDDEFVVTVDLPGFNSEDIDVRVTDHTLRIEADHEETIEGEGEAEPEDERFLRRERRHKSTQRSIKLPGEVDKDGVEARIKNGVLTVRLPKLEIETAREIEVEGD